MSNNFRVFNVTRGFSLKYSQALKAVEACACAWVDYGRTIRDLTLAEAIKARHEQARLAAPLPSPEIPGLRYEAPESKRDAQFWATRSGLLQEASRLNGLTSAPVN